MEYSKFIKKMTWDDKIIYYCSKVLWIWSPMVIILFVLPGIIRQIENDPLSSLSAFVYLFFIIAIYVAMVVVIFKTLRTILPMLSKRYINEDNVDIKMIFDYMSSKIENLEKENIKIKLCLKKLYKKQNIKC